MIALASKKPSWIGDFKVDWSSGKAKTVSNNKSSSSSSSSKKSSSSSSSGSTVVGYSPSSTTNVATRQTGVSSGKTTSSTPSWQDRLKQYETDHEAAMREIERAKSVYEQERAAWEALHGAGTFYNTDRAQQIHHWANQVRDASGISANDPRYGNPSSSSSSVPSGTGYLVPIPTMSGDYGEPDYALPQGAYAPARMRSDGSGSDIMPINPQPVVEEPPMDQTDMLIEQLLGLMGAMGNQNAAQWQSYMDQARLQAARTAEERRNALNNLISSLEGGQSSELEMLNANLATARQDLEDRTFQDYLAARQAMANRGLAGSGLASDQDTRLLLGQGRELARINQFGQAQSNEIMRRYANQLADAQQRLAGVSQSDIEAQLFQQMFESGNAQLRDMAEIYLDLIGKTIGYDRVKPEDVLNLQFNYDKLASEERRALANLSSEEARFYSQLNTDAQIALAKIKADYDVRMTDIMGVDSQGRPTLDAHKLAEQIRSNKASESINWSRINLDSRRLEQQMAQFKSELDLNIAKLRNTQWAQQADNISQIIKSKGDTISMLTKQLDALGSTQSDREAKEAIREEIALHMRDQQSYVEALDYLTYALEAQEVVQRGGSAESASKDILTSSYESLVSRYFKESNSNSNKLGPRR